MNRATLVAVVPREKAEALLEARRGWRAGRSNNLTTTLHLEFETEAQAMSAGRKLPFTWSVERMPAP